MNKEHGCPPAPESSQASTALLLLLPLVARKTWHRAEAEQGKMSADGTELSIAFQNVEEGLGCKDLCESTTRPCLNNTGGDLAMEVGYSRSRSPPPWVSYGLWPSPLSFLPSHGTHLSSERRGLRVSDAFYREMASVTQVESWTVQRSSADLAKIHWRSRLYPLARIT